VRSYTSTTVAMIFTFLASGFFHEWIVTVFLYREECERCFYPQMLGAQMMFFIWNAIVVAIEFSLGQHFSLTNMIGITLPPAIVSFLALYTALPIVHWFMNDYCESGWFHHGIIGFPSFFVEDY